MVTVVTQRIEKLKQVQLERSHEESAVGNQVDKTGEMTEELLPKRSGGRGRSEQLLNNCKEGRNATIEGAR